jgi:cell wall-associated NlpC family hydrolase
MKRDRRITPHSGRVAHVSLRGTCQAEAFVDGDPLRVVAALTDLCDGPAGSRDRQLLLGDAFLALDHREGWVFGQSDRGGYCGWVAAPAVAVAPAPTHWVATLATHIYPEPRVQARVQDTLSLGVRLTVEDTHGTWARTASGWVPAAHLRALGNWATDPVTVAEQFLGTPYLWGGNSRLGLDCSGLVQAAWSACGQDCPGDSDQQQALGSEVMDPLRGDLVFWRGHVAIVTGSDRILHANGHTMNVAHEGLAVAIARIAAAGGGPVLQIRRAPPRSG